MMRLRNHIALVYALFICLGVLALGVLVNSFARKLFSEYITENIRLQNSEIVRFFADQYDPFMMSYNFDNIDAVGMHYLHQGYLVSLEDTRGTVLWDIRDMDMEECASIVEEISARMRGEYGLDGSFRRKQYALSRGNLAIGNLNIESYGPFFYRDNEAAFLETLNRFLFIAGAVFVFLSVIVSLCLAAALARPVLRARDAARRIAAGDFSVRIPDRNGTKELHELSRAVNDLAGELEKGEQWQRRLGSDIAHELRTPLTTLQGNIEAMLDGIWEPAPERLQTCHEEILRLHRLVEDLSLLSILEQRQIVLSKSDFDLGLLVSKAAEQFIPLAREKGITLNTDLPRAPVHADQDRLMQVFVNLLSNAVKYTDSGGITVRLRPCAAGEGGTHEITIADTGAGIPGEDLPHIFKRLYRSDKSRSRDTGGAGIGLSIAAAIVEAHGGRITAANNPGGNPGSLFTVIL